MSIYTNETPSGLAARGATTVRPATMERKVFKTHLARPQSCPGRYDDDLEAEERRDTSAADARVLDSSATQHQDQERLVDVVHEGIRILRDRHLQLGDMSSDNVT